MRSLTIALVVSATLAFAGSASAAVQSFTEGQRDLVAGSTAVVPTDASSGAPGFDLGVVGFGAGEFQQTDLHGRIVGATDTYSFTATSDFIIEFIFGDIALDNGGTITGGFVIEGGGSNTSNFELNLGGMGVPGSPLSFMTDITSGPSLIIAGVAGVYTFVVDNTGPGSAAATYDIRILATPIPAALPLMIAGIGGLGFAARRKKSAQ